MPRFVKKNFILDTSVLLYHEDSIHVFGKNNVWIPMVVLEELDTFKTRNDSVGNASRYINRFLDIKHLHMKKYVPALKNHATSIHHYKKMKELMDVEPETERSYDNFRAKMEKEGHNLLMKDYTKAIREMALVQERLETLKKMI